jgi:hypothetical protein
MKSDFWLSHCSGKVRCVWHRGSAEGTFALAAGKRKPLCDWGSVVDSGQKQQFSATGEGAY